MEFHKLDDHHVEILAGDIPSGFWSFKEGSLNQESIPDGRVDLKQNIKSMNVRLERSVSKLDSQSDLPAGHIAGMALGMLLGPLGSIASNILSFATGSHKFVCIGCELMDGRKFIARMRQSVHEKWKEFQAPSAD